VNAARKVAAVALCLFSGLSVGCASAAAVQSRIETIHSEHGVVVRADNPLSRCYLCGNLPGLLDRIDRDLARTPRFFRENIGPVIIEESFADNPAVYPFPLFVRGYVDPGEAGRGFPVHVKNRSLLEKLLLMAPRDGELFLHEASHSFEFTIYTEQPERWRRFMAEFEAAGGLPYLPRPFGALAYAAAATVLPPVAYLRVPSMPSLYGWLDHFEDFAETHCYLVRHDGDVEFLRDSDPALLAKCRAVRRLTGGMSGAEANSPE
jgi:hypothetical protein